MNICRYHLYYVCIVIFILMQVLGPARLLNSALCKEIMRYLPVRIQSQDPHLLFTTLLHGYHVTHLIEFVFIDSFISRRAEANKPTLLLLQIEHNGNLIGLYREDRWSRRHGVHGSPDTILFSIEFTWKKRELITMIRKWVGGKSRIE